MGGFNVYAGTVLAPRAAPKTHPRRNFDIWEILEAVLVIFWRFWLPKSSNWDPTAAPASILASFWKPCSINFHNFFGIKFCMPFLNAFFSASDACFYQCPPVSCIKIIASTARISRCRRSPRTTINKNTTKNRNLEKGRTRGVPCTKFWGHFWHIFGQKCVQKSMRTNMLKNTSKNLKIKPKTRHDPTPKNRDSLIYSAKAVPSK